MFRNPFQSSIVIGKKEFSFEDAEIGVDIAEALEVLQVVDVALSKPETPLSVDSKSWATPRRKENLKNLRQLKGKSISQSSSGVFSDQRGTSKFDKIKNEVQKRVHDKLHWEIFATLPKKVEEKKDPKRPRRPRSEFKSALCRYRGHKFPTFECEDRIEGWIKNSKCYLTLNAKLNIEPCQQFFLVQVFVTSSSLLALEGGIDLQCDILIDDIDTVEIDVFKQIVHIRLKERTLTISHSDQLEELLGVLEFFKRKSGHFRNFLVPISWTGSELDFSSFHLVEFAEISQRDSSNFQPKEGHLMYRELDDVLDDSTKQPWRFGHFTLKLNALYLLSEDDGNSSMPQKFWILNENNVEISEDSKANRPHVVKLQFSWEQLELSLSSSEELKEWINVMKSAVTCKVADVNKNNSITNRTTFNDVALSLNDRSMTLFQCFGGHLVSVQKASLQQVMDVDQMPNKASEIKVTLRTNESWRIYFTTSKHRHQFWLQWNKIVQQ